MKYAKAVKECSKKDARLFEPKDLETNELVFKTSKEVGQTFTNDDNKWIFWWIGIHDLGNEGNFSYQSDKNGAELEWTNFSQCEPNNFGRNGEDCVQFNGLAKNGKWNDANCNANCEFICEKIN